MDSAASQYVKLNVGGALFQTTLATLTKYDCMFRAMFSGRNEIFRDSEGYVLIDRCGKHFGLILNFLREGNLPLPECQKEIREILTEAKYYLIQELIDLCVSWLDKLEKRNYESVGICQVPVVASKKQVEQILKSCTGRPVIELLLNRSNNKYSYNVNSDENFLRNQELFDKLLLRFNSSKNNNVMFIKNLGIGGSSEICQWTFYGNGNRKVEISCTSIVYTPEKKQTKVEFPEARIYEEALNALLTFNQQSDVCAHCKVEGTARAESVSDRTNKMSVKMLTGGDYSSNGRMDWRMEQLALGSSLGNEECYFRNREWPSKSGVSADISAGAEQQVTSSSLQQGTSSGLSQGPKTAHKGTEYDE